MPLDMRAVGDFQREEPERAEEGVGPVVMGDAIAPTVHPVGLAKLAPQATPDEAVEVLMDVQDGSTEVP